MRVCLAVPTYWTHPGGQGAEDLIYDHPTPLDAPGTLRRFLDSASAFLGPQTQVVVVAAATAQALQEAVEERVQEILARFSSPWRPRLFSYTHLHKLQRYCLAQGQGELAGLLSLSGYAAIRNLTLVAANLLDADILVSLDDDEIIADPAFLDKISADFAILANDYGIFGLAGLYENPQESIFNPEPTDDWASFWPKLRWLNEALAALAADSPPLKLTSVALGGNMALGRDLYRLLPFDPAVSRGEDIDYVINARMFQVPFFLDHTLRIVHDPPVKPHPLWRRLRQDLQRFWYTRQKLLAQEASPLTALISPAELMPYPGNFLTDDLEIRAYRTHAALALQYLAAGEAEEARQTLLNLAVCHQQAPGANAFRTYLEVVQRWRRLQTWLAQPQVREAAAELLWG